MRKGASSIIESKDNSCAIKYIVPLFYKLDKGKDSKSNYLKLQQKELSHLFRQVKHYKQASTDVGCGLFIVFLRESFRMRSLVITFIMNV